VPVDVICGIGDVSAFTVAVFTVVLHDPQTVQVPAPPRLALPHRTNSPSHPARKPPHNSGPKHALAAQID
jgi:hypothetical protein